jgi:hypothetical protein
MILLNEAQPLLLAMAPAFSSPTSTKPELPGDLARIQPASFLVVPANFSGVLSSDAGRGFKEKAFKTFSEELKALPPKKAGPHPPYWGSECGIAHPDLRQQAVATYFC